MLSSLCSCVSAVKSPFSNWLAFISGLGFVGLFVFADPLVAEFCDGRAIAACGGVGGRFALVTLLRAAFGIPLVALWWRPPPRPRLPLKRGAMFVAALAMAAMLLAGAAAYEVLVGGPSEFVVEVWRTARPRWLLGLAVLAAAPLFEELLFRGLLFDLLRRWSLSAAVAGSSLAWTAVHGQYDPSGMFVLFWLGVLLAFARLLGGGVLLPVSLHALWNFRALAATAIGGQA